MQMQKIWSLTYTGKTETVKALGSSLGRFVLVFCCDNAFDYQAMGRIFVGLCQVGAWGCFDEFNRLEQGMLSAISQQIQTIQTGLMTSNKSEEITLVGRKIKLHDETGSFFRSTVNGLTLTRDFYNYEPELCRAIKFA